jgi:cytochrome c oxidase subunit 3
MMQHSSEFVIEKHFDPVGARVGMWLFLLTEFLLFGGLFLLYSIYLNKYPEEFHYASGNLNRFLGAMNTIILLTSSLTMALSIGALQRDNRKLSISFLVITFLLGSAFLVNKYFEWGAKISHGIYPGSGELATHPKGEILFYGLYYTMTGLHGLHVVVGMVIMGFLLYFLIKKSHKAFSISPSSLEKFHGKKIAITDEKGKKLWVSDPLSEQVKEIDLVVKGVITEQDTKSNIVRMENSGLYWHLVDIIWIFLFPLFYLVAM